MNYGRSVSYDGYKAKGASVDYYSNSSHTLIIIVYQQQTVWGSAINADIFENGLNQRHEVLVNYNHSAGDFDLFDAKPVVAINSNAQVLIAWLVDGEMVPPFSNSGIYYNYGYVYHFYGISWYFNWYTSSPVKLSGWSIGVGNSSLSVFKSWLQPFQFVYESGNRIYYQTLTDNINYVNHIQEGIAQNISRGGGYTYNNNPSIIAVSGGAKVVWEGNNNGLKKKVAFHDTGTSYFDSFSYTGGSYDALSPNINQPDDHSTYYFGWSENNSGYVLNNTFTSSNIKSLGISGGSIYN